VPVLITRSLGAYAPHGHLAGVTEDEFVPFVTLASARGLPVFDEVLETNFARPRTAPPDYRRLLGGVRPGLTFCAFHPNAPGPGEIEVIEPDTFHVRTDEYDLFRDAAWATWIAEQPVRLIGMRDLRDRMRVPAP
jgi:hypothetical protein